jgi:hypothetical protein
MARAIIIQELYCEVKDEPGLLGRITAAMALEGVYIVHLSAFSIDGKGILHLITKDNHKARKAIGYFIPTITERDVIIVEFENKVGTLAPVAKLLGNHDIAVTQVFGTSGDGFKIVGVFSTNDNARAVQLINEDSGALGVRPS